MSQLLWLHKKTLPKLVAYNHNIYFAHGPAAGQGSAETACFCPPCASWGSLEVEGWARVKVCAGCRAAGAARQNLHTASSRGLGFLTMWRLCSKPSISGESQVAAALPFANYVGSHITFSHHILATETISRGGKQ